MNHKERMDGALRHQEIDRLPTQINYTGGMGQAMADHFGIEVGEVARWQRNGHIDAKTGTLRVEIGGRLIPEQSEVRR